jgi:two-component system sensor histidine kinase and response regulator WspE
MSDPVLLGLFDEEVQQLLPVLVRALQDLEAGIEGFDGLRRQLMSMKAAAQIIGLDAVQELLRALEVPLKEPLPPGDPQRETLRLVLAALPEVLTRAEEPAYAELRLRPLIERLLPPETSAGSESAPKPTIVGRAQQAEEQRMLELFRQEIDEHLSALSRGLLLLEGSADPGSLVQPLMRAAHSVKGAARAVRQDAAVRLAHAIEDQLTAMARGARVPNAAAVSLLLRCCDHLLQLAAGLKHLGDATLDAESRLLLEQLAELEAAPAEAEAGTPAAPAASAGEAATSAPGRVDPHIRVRPEQVGTLLGLAAESVVESRRMEGFRQQLRFLRQEGHRWSGLLEQLHQQLGAPNALDPVGRVIAELRHSLVGSRGRMSVLTDEFGQYARRGEELAQRLYRAAAGIRMRPIADALLVFPRMVRDLAERLGKRVQLKIEGSERFVDRDVLLKLEAPLTQLIRNAIDHGVEAPAERRAAGKPEAATLSIRVEPWQGMLLIELSDDGRGVDPDRVRQRLLDTGQDARRVQSMDQAALLDQLFAAGFSTAARVSELSGRGVGLDLVRQSLHEIGGSVRISSQRGVGTSFQLLVPVSRAVVRSVVVRVAGEQYGFPLARIERLLKLPHTELAERSLWQFVHLGGQNVVLLSLAGLLELGPARETGDLVAVVISDQQHQYAFAVEAVLGEFDLNVRPIDPRLGRVADLSAAALLPDGSPVLLIDVDDLLRNAERTEREARVAGIGRPQRTTQRRALVVDDSISVRELERQLLRGAGFEVEVAVDGADGWNKVRDSRFDIVITDVDMPRMDGIALTRSIKQDPRLRHLPVVIVSYRDRPEDRARGLEARADSYITKSDFQDERFLAVVADLIGPVDGA